MDPLVTMLLLKASEQFYGLWIGSADERQSERT
jgi:hypothetical protein